MFQSDAGALLLLALSLVLAEGELARGLLPDANRTLTETLPLTVQLARTEGSSFNPFTDLGQSLDRIPQSQASYPPMQFLRACLPAHRALGISILLHHALLLLTTYWLLRRSGSGPPLAVLGGIVFGYSGPVLGQFDNVPALSAMAWLPLLLIVGTPANEPGRTDGWSASSRAGATSLLICMVILAGDPATSIVVLASQLVVSWARRPGSRESWNRLWLPAGITLAGCLVATGIVGSWSTVDGRSFAAERSATAAPASPVSLWTLVVPFARGGPRPLDLAPAREGAIEQTFTSWMGLSHGPGPWCGPGQFGEAFFYLGALPLLLLLMIRVHPVRCGKEPASSGSGGRWVLGLLGLVVARVLPPFTGIWDSIPALFRPAPSILAGVLALAVGVLVVRRLLVVLEPAEHPVSGDEMDHASAPDDRPGSGGSWSVRGSPGTLFAFLAAALIAAAALRVDPRSFGCDIDHPIAVKLPDSTSAGRAGAGRVLSTPAPVFQLSGQCAFTAFWIGALALVVRGLLLRFRAGSITDRSLLASLILLAWVDQSVVVGRRTWGFVEPPRDELATTPKPAKMIDPSLAPRILLLRPGEPTVPDVLGMMPLLPGTSDIEALQKSLFRGGMVNVLAPVPILDGSRAEPPFPGLRTFLGHWPPDPHQDEHLLAMLGIQVVASSAALSSSPSFRATRWVEILGKYLTWYRLTPMAAIATLVHPMGPPGSRREKTDALARVQQRLPAVVIDLPGNSSVLAAPAGAPGERVTALRASPTLLEFQVVNRTKGFLMVPIAHVPGWKTQVDHAPRELLDACGMISVALEPGVSHVRFEFQDPAAARQRNAAGILTIFAGFWGLVSWVLVGRRRLARSIPELALAFPMVFSLLVTPRTSHAADAYVGVTGPFSGNVTVNGAPVTKGTLLRPTDRLVVQANSFVSVAFPGRNSAILTASEGGPAAIADMHLVGSTPPRAYVALSAGTLMFSTAYSSQSKRVAEGIDLYAAGVVTSLKHSRGIVQVENGSANLALRDGQATWGDRSGKAAVPVAAEHSVTWKKGDPAPGTAAVPWDDFLDSVKLNPRASEGATKLFAASWQPDLAGPPPAAATRGSWRWIGLGLFVLFLVFLVHPRAGLTATVFCALAGFVESAYSLSRIWVDLQSRPFPLGVVLVGILVALWVRAEQASKKETASVLGLIVHYFVGLVLVLALNVLVSQGPMGFAPDHPGSFLGAERHILSVRTGIELQKLPPSPGTSHFRQEAVACLIPLLLLLLAGEARRSCEFCKEPVEEGSRSYSLDPENADWIMDMTRKSTRIELLRNLRSPPRRRGNTGVSLTSSYDWCSRCLVGKLTLTPDPKAGQKPPTSVELRGEDLDPRR